MANFLNSHVRQMGESDSVLYEDLLSQVLQAALLAILLWFVMKVVMRELPAHVHPAPDTHWAMASLDSVCEVCSEHPRVEKGWFV